MTDPCKYEVVIAILEENVKDIREDVKEVLRIIRGNGQIGLTTQAELNKTAINRIWKFMWVVLVILCGGLIKSFFF